MSWMDAELDKGKMLGGSTNVLSRRSEMPGGSTYVLGCRSGRLAAFRLFWTGWQNRWWKSASFLNGWRKTVH